MMLYIYEMCSLYIVVFDNFTQNLLCTKSAKISRTIY